MKPKTSKTPRYDEYQEREKEDVLDEKVQKYKAMFLMKREECNDLKGQIEVLEWERNQNPYDTSKSQQVAIDLQSKLDKLESAFKDLQEEYTDLRGSYSTHLNKTALHEKRYTGMRQELLSVNEKAKQAENGLERMAMVLAEVQASEARYKESEAYLEKELGKWKYRHEEMAAKNGKKAATIATLEEALRKRSKEDEQTDCWSDKKFDGLPAAPADSLTIQVGLWTTYVFCRVRLIHTLR